MFTMAVSVIGHVRECALLVTTLDGSKCEFKVGGSRKKRCEMRSIFYINLFGTAVEEVMKNSKQGEPLRSMLQLPRKR